MKHELIEAPHTFTVPQISIASKTTALAMLALMTVVFAIYQFLASTGRIPPFLGGYMGIAGAVLAPLAIVIYMCQILPQSWRFNRGDTLFLMFVLMIAVVAGVNYLYERALDVAEDHFKVIPQLIVLFVAFRFIDFRSQTTRRVMWVSFGVTTAIILALDLGTLSQDYASLHNTGSDDIANYQSFAMFYVFLMIYCICVSRSLPLRALVYMVASIALFRNGARSEMIAVIPIIATVEAFLSRRNTILIFVSAAVLIIFFRDIVGILEAAFPDNRIVYLLRDMAFDQSAIERQYMLDYALIIIEESPFFGDYGYYALGEYTHNGLSAWADFGLFGFMLFVSLLAFPLTQVLRDYIERRIDPETLALAAFTVSGVLLFTFAKYYAHPMIAIIPALYARAKARRQIGQFLARHAMS